jgi:hypothetical protein
MPVDYKFLPSATLKDANGNAQTFPDWARGIIVNEALIDWRGASNKYQNGTQVMSATLAGGARGRYFDPNGELAAFQGVYAAGVLGFQGVGVDVFANISFRFEDFGDVVIDALLKGMAWPGKPAGPWQPWSSRTAGLEKDPNGALTGVDANGNPVAIPIDGLLGVWIPSQIVQQQKTVFDFPHDFQSDVILFNSRVNWNKKADDPAANQLDFYHVALHEIGHGLGMDHTVPEPGTLALVGVGLAALVAMRRPRRQ